MRARLLVTVGSALSIALLAAPGSRTAYAQNRLPANTVPVPATNFVQPGGGTATYNVNGAAARVNVTGPATILRWNSMDVGAGATLNFAMPSATARVLNQVTGGAINNMTTIEGALRSNGQVYIYNPNGIVFGQNATVDVNALIASTLKLDDRRFLDGLLSSPTTTPNFAADATLGSSFVPGAIIVEGNAAGGTLQQAALTAQQNGLVMLLAPQVVNNGRISAPDGQVVLAAGSKVYLAAPEDSRMRGLRVEVDHAGLAALAVNATNGVKGSIDVQRGNVSMVGLAVNQQGRAQALTSVNLNGSIYLRAQSGAQKNEPTVAAVATSGGTLTLGTGSTTTVLPDYADPTTAALPPAGPAFNPSQIDLTGKTIALGADARVVAPAGLVNLTARANPAVPDITATDARITLGAGSVIDVSGSTGTILPMESNVLKVELRGNELADNVLLRDSAVRGQTVYVDRRKVANGMPIANITGYLNLVEHNVGELTAAGGTVNVTAEGTVAQQVGSRLDVSGGKVTYASGNIATSKLTLAGRAYDIETASASLPYDGVLTPVAGPANFENGYVEGKSAGTARFSAATLALDGALAGAVTIGARQRDVAAASRPQGGQLVIGAVSDATLDPVSGRAVLAAVDQFGFTGDVRIGNAAGAPGGATLNLDPAQLTSAGFSRLTVLTSGNASVAGPVALADGGQLRLGAAGDISVAGSLDLHGGSATLTAGNVLSVAEGSRLDLSGSWRNDSNLANPQRDANGVPTGDITTRGGTLRLFGNTVTVGDRAAVDVSGGAWMNAAGTITGGDAGGITLQAVTRTESLDASLRLGEDVSLRGVGLSKGGSLSLTGRNVSIGAPVADAADLALDPAWFASGGFASRSITAGGNLEVAAGVQIAPRAESWQLNRGIIDYAQVASAPMQAVATTTLLPLAGPQGARQASNLSLRAAGRPQPGDGLGVVRIGTGAVIDADPGATVTLAADRQVLVDGTVSAPGGRINLQLLPGVPDNTALFDPTRQVTLGANARVSAAGTAARVYVSPAGLATGEVLDGGTISIANGNLTVAGSVTAAPGSVLDVSGAAASALRFKSGSGITDPIDVGSAGGTIDVRAREALILAGSLRGAAGNGAARGGTLAVTLDREDSAGGPDFPQQPRNLILSAAPAGTLLPAGGATPGEGRVSAQSVADGGFANVRLKSQDVITLGAADGAPVQLAAGSSIALDAPTLRAGLATGTPTAATLSAPYVSIANNDVRYQGRALAISGGAASLAVRANALDLAGTLATQGFGMLDLAAQGDVRLSGVLPNAANTALAGSLTTAANLALTAAQVYPTTLSEVTLALTGANSTLRVANSGQVPGSLSSAGGSLIARASTIVQDGRVLAPFGTIDLEAGSDVRFGPASVTSVAGNGSVPFGTVSNGSEWSVAAGVLNLGVRAAPSSNPEAGETGVPAKTLRVSAPVITQQAGARFDLSGGGQLGAYEVVSGPGGSTDVLTGTGTNPVYAIVPGWQGSTAPVASDGSALKAGEQVWLSGMPGLPAGYYTLLPPHHALQPGAFAIQAVAGLRDMRPVDNRANADSSWLVAGARRSATDGRGDTRTSGFALMPYTLVRQRSEFKLYDADSFFGAEAARSGVAAPALPADGGRLAIETTRSLALEGTTRMAGSGGGLAGSIDIAAPLIDVVAQRDAATGEYVRVVAGDLVAAGAGSVTLGARRTRGSASDRLDVVAGRVRIDNAGAPLTAAEVVLAASDTVELAPGARVLAQGGARAPTRPLDIAAPAGQGDGALTRVATGAGVAVSRPAGAGRTGTVSIAPAAELSGSGAVLLDATRAMDLSGNVGWNDGADLTVRAPRIALGDGAPADGSARFDNAALARMGRLDNLTLSSSAALALQPGAQLGSDQLGRLTIAAAGIQGSGAGDNLIAARALALGGVSVAAATPGVDGSSGRLAVRAQSIDLAGGTVAVRGYGKVDVQTAGEVRAGGTANVGLLAVDNALDITAARIGAGDGAVASIRAGGDVRLMAAPAAGGATALAPPGSGGQLSIAGATLTSNLDLSARGGSLALSGARGLTLTGGTLDVSGSAVAFGSGAAYLPGGAVSLDGGAGAVTVAPATVIDVSTPGAVAGSLTVLASDAAAGRVDLQGQLRGAAGGAGSTPGIAVQQGSFTLDVGNAMSAAQFDALNARLNAAGFTEAREVRVRNGDLVQATGGQLQSRAVTLAADRGNVVLDGTIDARGASGGSIEIFAAQDQSTGDAGRIRLEQNARLLAAALASGTGAGSQGVGGQVLLATGNRDGLGASRVDGGASISAAQGAVIDVSARNAAAGRVTVRAPRVANSDVAVAQFKAEVKGAGSFAIEGNQVYTAASISAAPDSATNLNAAPTGRMGAEAAAFMGRAANIAARLGRSDAAVRSAIEVRSGGDLTVSVNEQSGDAAERGWNLNDWRFGGQAGSLLLRAQGDLSVNGSISDGFVKSAGQALPFWQVDTSAQSWSLTLVGGADAGAARATAVQPLAARGDVRIDFARQPDPEDMAVSLLRTGTGTIDIAAGRNLVLGKSVLKDPDGDVTLDVPVGATVYTAGRLDPASFTQIAAAGAPGGVRAVYQVDTGHGLETFAAPDSRPVSVYGIAPATEAAFTSGGGTIRLSAAGDVVGAGVPQVVNNWMYRQGRTVTDAQGRTVFETLKDGAGRVLGTLGTAWWSQPESFIDGVATFGGGNISVRAGGAVRDLSANAASSAFMAGAAPDSAGLREFGGGNVRVRAGGDVGGGSFYAQRGAIDVAARGAVTSGTAVIYGDVDGETVATPLSTVLALGNGSARVVAGRDLTLETIYNPTLTMQNTSNVATGLTVGDGRFDVRNDSSQARAYRQAFGQYGAFVSYGADSTVDLASLGGNLLLNVDPFMVSGAGGGALPVADYGAAMQGLYGVLPPSLRATAFGGSVNAARGFALAPSATGQLALQARDSVRLASDDTSFLKTVMLDADPASLVSVAAPRALVRDDLRLFSGRSVGIAGHAASTLHANDAEPVRIVALQGDVIGSPESRTLLDVAKRAEIIAGRDVVDFGFTVQHAGADDVTLVAAGRDVIDTTNGGGAGNVAHVVTGPGLVALAAGRNIDLGNSDGVMTRGNLDNPYLPEGGAAIMAVAGYGGALGTPQAATTDVAALSANPAANAAAPSARAQRAANTAWFDALVAAADAGLKDAATRAAAAGVSLNSPAGAVLRDQALAGFDGTIAAAYAPGQITGGDIKVFGSQVRTEQGGSIDLIAPGGSVIAGLVTASASINKAASQNGIFTVRGGAIRSLVSEDFTVNQGRVFSLGGGDITLISQSGNIDAGRGSKTAVSAPPPLLTTDAAGNTRIDISGSIAGSGIATLRTAPTQPASDVTALAPRGIFDAGDAGVRSTGKVEVQAAVVLNAANITASGGVSGSVAVGTAGIAAAPAAPAASATAGQDAARQIATAPKETLTLSVEVLCFGSGDEGGSCKDGARAGTDAGNAVSLLGPDRSSPAN